MDITNTIWSGMGMPSENPFDYLNTALTEYHASLESFYDEGNISINSIKVIQSVEVVIDVLRIFYNYIREIKSITKDFDSADYEMIETLFLFNINDTGAFENFRMKFDNKFFVKRLEKSMEKIQKIFDFVMEACAHINLAPEKNIFLKVLSNHRKMVNQLYLLAVNIQKGSMNEERLKNIRNKIGPSDSLIS